MDVNQLAYQYFGRVNLMEIGGVSHATVMSVMSEVGLDGFSKFETSKQLPVGYIYAPIQKLTWAKSNSHITKGGNKLKIALRNAANAIVNLKDTHYLIFLKGYYIKR